MCVREKRVNVSDKRIIIKFFFTAQFFDVLSCVLNLNIFSNDPKS